MAGCTVATALISFTGSAKFCQSYRWCTIRGPRLRTGRTSPWTPCSMTTAGGGFCCPPPRYSARRHAGPSNQWSIQRRTRPRGDQEITHWFEADQAVAYAEAAAAEPVRQPSAEEFYDWLGTLIDRFQHAVEQSDLWRALWDDKLTRPRGEKIIQAIAGTMWTILCEAADVDITREANVGRGPVDFKFSAGWRRRALIEVKLLASSKLSARCRSSATAIHGQRTPLVRLLRLRRFHRRRLPPGTPSARPRHMRGVPGKIQKNGDSAFHRCETKEVSFEARTSLAKLTRASSCTQRPTAQIISHPRACTDARPFAVCTRARARPWDAKPSVRSEFQRRPSAFQGSCHPEGIYPVKLQQPSSRVSTLSLAILRIFNRRNKCTGVCRIVCGAPVGIRRRVAGLWGFCGTR